MNIFVTWYTEDIIVKEKVVPFVIIALS